MRDETETVEDPETFREPCEEDMHDWHWNMRMMAEDVMDRWDCPVQGPGGPLDTAAIL